MGKLGVMNVTATTKIDGKVYDKSGAFPFPVFDSNLAGLVEFFHSAEEVYKMVYHTHKIVKQNVLRLELEAEHAGKEPGKRTKRDESLSKLIKG